MSTSENASIVRTLFDLFSFPGPYHFTPFLFFSLPFSLFLLFSLFLRVLLFSFYRARFLSSSTWQIPPRLLHLRTGPLPLLLPLTFLSRISSFLALPPPVILSSRGASTFFLAFPFSPGFSIPFSLKLAKTIGGKILKRPNSKLTTNF